MIVLRFAHGLGQCPVFLRFLWSHLFLFITRTHRLSALFLIWTFALIVYSSTPRVRSLHLLFHSHLDSTRLLVCIRSYDGKWDLTASFLCLSRRLCQRHFIPSLGYEPRVALIYTRRLLFASPTAHSLLYVSHA